MMTDGRGHFVAVFPATISLGLPFEKGPLKLQGERGTDEAFVSDTENRQRYVADPFARSMLWGNTSEDRRYHHAQVSEAAFVTSRGTAIAVRFDYVELLRFDADEGRRGLAVVHGELRPSPGELVDSLVELADIDTLHGAEVRQAYQHYLGGQAIIDPSSRRARMLYLVDVDGFPELDHDSHLSAVNQWLWYLATCQMPGRITIPHGAGERVDAGRIATSGRWHSAAFGDAVVHLTSHQGERDAGERVDFERRHIRFRTIETDLVLLAEAQSSLCLSIEGQLAAMQTDINAPLDIGLSRHLLSLFRSTFWGDQVLERGPGVRLFELLRQHASLPRRTLELRVRMEALERDVQSALTSRTNAALGLIATLGLPMSVALTAWSVSGSRDPWMGVFAVLAALGASGLLLALLPGLRRLIADSYIVPLGRWR